MCEARKCTGAGERAGSRAPRLARDRGGTAPARPSLSAPRRARDAGRGCAASRRPLLPRHLAHVERVGRLLVLGLLQLLAVHELHVGDRSSRRLPGVLVLEPGAERGEDIGPIIVERGRRAPVIRTRRDSKLRRGTPPSGRAIGVAIHAHRPSATAADGRKLESRRNHACRIREGVRPRSSESRAQSLHRRRLHRLIVWHQPSRASRRWPSGYAVGAVIAWRITRAPAFGAEAPTERAA
jgi:hypothetical protein